MIQNKHLGVGEKLKFSSYIIALMLVLELVNMFTNRLLTQLAIVPREPSFLFGIFTSPFIHKDFHHFLSNMLTLFVFNYLLLNAGLKHYFKVIGVSILATGLLVWMFAKTGAHVGASGVIYAMFAYLIVAGFKSRQFSQILVSIFIIVFYGGLLWGVLPRGGFISWESHLFGFVVGCMLAWYLNKK